MSSKINWIELDYDTRWKLRRNQPIKPQSIDTYIENAKKKYHEDMKEYEESNDIDCQYTNLNKKGINGALNDIKDRRQIYDDIKNDIPDELNNLGHIEGLFVHVDNVRYIYKNHNKNPPQWFTQKYGHLYEDQLLKLEI